MPQVSELSYAFVLVVPHAFSRSFVDVTERVIRFLVWKRLQVVWDVLQEIPRLVKVAAYTFVVFPFLGFVLNRSISGVDIHNPYPPPPLWYGYLWVALAFVTLFWGLAWGSLDAMAVGHVRRTADEQDDEMVAVG